MSARAARAESMIRRISNETRLTESGRVYLENAIDPFPDSRRTLTGYPDTSSGASIVPKIKQSVTITFDNSHASWDLHIFNLPILANQTGGSGLATATNQPFASGGKTTYWTVGSPTGIQCAGVICASLPTGVPLNMKTLGQTYPVSFLSIPTAYLNDPSRAIASAIEIHNVSNKLSVQGSMICYRQPINTPLYSEAITCDGGDPNHVQAVSIVRIPSPPSTPATALGLADSVQWEAEKGAYIVHALHNAELPTNSFNGVQAFYYDVNANDSLMACQSSATPPGKSGLAWGLNYWAEFEMSGALMTGLAPGNSIVINWNLILELFPGNNSAFVNLADPSPEADWRALELVSILHREMPVAVTVDRNGWGDWISEAMEVVRDTVAPTLSSVAKMIPHPSAQMLGTAVEAFMKKKHHGPEAIQAKAEHKLLPKHMPAPSSGKGTH